MIDEVHSKAVFKEATIMSTRHARIDVCYLRQRLYASLCPNLFEFSPRWGGKGGVVALFDHFGLVLAVSTGVQHGKYKCTTLQVLTWLLAFHPPIGVVLLWNKVFFSFANARYCFLAIWKTSFLGSLTQALLTTMRMGLPSILSSVKDLSLL